MSGANNGAVDVQGCVKIGNTPRDVYQFSQRILDEGYTVQCPVMHCYDQEIQPPYASVPGDPCWAVMIDEPFRENQLVIIEPNPTTPDLQCGFFIGGMNVVTETGCVRLHEYPLQLTIKGV